MVIAVTAVVCVLFFIGFLFAFFKYARSSEGYSPARKFKYDSFYASNYYRNVRYKNCSGTFKYVKNYKAGKYKLHLDAQDAFLTIKFQDNKKTELCTLTTEHLDAEFTLAEDCDCTMIVTFGDKTSGYYVLDIGLVLE